MHGARREAWRAPVSLLELHVVLDGLHAVHGLRHFHGRRDVLARAHEAAQLNDALERLDVDLGDFQARLAQKGGLDSGGDDAVVDVLSRTPLRAGEPNRETAPPSSAQLRQCVPNKSLVKTQPEPDTSWTRTSSSTAGAELPMRTCTVTPLVEMFCVRKAAGKANESPTDIPPPSAARARPTATDTAIPARAKRIIRMIGTRRSEADLIGVSSGELDRQGECSRQIAASSLTTQLNVHRSSGLTM